MHERLANPNLIRSPALTHPRGTRQPTVRMVPGGHKKRMDPSEIIITALAIIAAVVAIGATAALVMRLY
jgi:hypothetical protein